MDPSIFTPDHSSERPITSASTFLDPFILKTSYKLAWPPLLAQPRAANAEIGIRRISDVTTYGAVGPHINDTNDGFLPC